MRGVSIPPLFLCVSLLLTEVHARHLFGLTVFPLYHIFPPGSEGLLDRCLTKPCAGSGVYCILGSPSSRLMIPRD